MPHRLAHLVTLPDTDVRQLRTGDPQRESCEMFVAERYLDHFGAHLKSFYPLLLTIQRRGHLTAVAGVRKGSEERFFSEAYLESRAECAISRHAGMPVLREDIAEFGHFCGSFPGANRYVIALIANFLQEERFRWALFTLTRSMRNNFLRLGVPLYEVCAAVPQQLGPQAAIYGSYYDHDPVVCFAEVRQGVAAIERCSR